MQKRKIGRSNLEVSTIGLGCWAIGGPFQRTSDGENYYPMGWGKVDDSESIRAIHRALELGINFFDTANNYGAGHSEKVLGQALAGKREGVVLATKFGSVFDEETCTHYDQDEDFVVTPDFIRQSCEGSLRRLQTDTIDLYQFHLGTYDPERALTVRETLEELVTEGKIRWYGWSTDRPDLARIFAQGTHCTAIQHRLNVLFDAPEMLALCEGHYLASINKSPLSSGILTGKFNPESTFPEDDGRRYLSFQEGSGAERLQQVEALRSILTQDGRTMVQGALAWNLTRHSHTIPIPGFKTVQQVEENAAVLGQGLLNEGQMEAIESMLGRTPEK